mmetsp:Transcript_26974/g.23862  ORF Transcript_26974/g.23862 Transcript_26974/m.23862 type:complete len:109 (+) Transcript_26974:82-408(+)
MIGIAIGIVIGMGILIVGTKKGWLTEKIERPEMDKPIKEKLTEDNEVFDPYKEFDSQLEDKLKNDEKFAAEFQEFTRSKKESLLKGLNPDERASLDKYIKEAHKRMKE